MNMSITSSQSTPRAEGRDSSRAAPREHAAQSRARDNFERALQARQQTPGDANEEGCPDEDHASGGAPAWLSALPAPPPVRSAAVQPSAGSAAVSEPASGTRAAIEASLTACPGQAVTPLTAADPAALWEVSVREPNAVPLQLRAERAPDADRVWGLTIGSPAAHTEVLARHASRLNERLRKHAIGLSHVRVERHEDPDER